MNVDEAKLKRKEWTAKRAEAGYTTATNRIAACRPEKDRHGDPGLHPGPHAARRQPQRLRPRAGHPVRQLRRQAGGDRAVRRYGGSRDNHVISNRLEDIAGKTRNIPEGCELLTVAKRMGISLG